ncbi:hypothetical protein E0485_10030 [Paenibacillus albiflavus]|uniref:Copper amine oxidase-like N-terminal domain-containing protein n=1 Tax=Paenibacillus albiflavus TaxID=2545760 RepID=A0A4R4ECX0_9BACL|nr:stalk domain-containing protein [Paenibacillus albiflavus]TCZ77804.1 hypothetical protein E0485_10030 [Paenibacillus albiflavus]
MKNKRMLIAIISLGLFAAISVSPLSALADRAIQLMMNGANVNGDFKPITIDGTTYVQLRPIAEELGATLTWDQDTNVVGILSSDNQSLAKQVKLLQQTILASTPEEAVQKYAEGVKTRNGAVQYAMLTPGLQDQKKSTFEEMSWVTGVSSPWVEKYTIDKGTQISEGQWKFKITYAYNTAKNESSTEEALVTVNKIKDYWYISSIE